MHKKILILFLTILTTFSFFDCKKESQGSINYTLLSATGWPSPGEFKRVMQAVKKGADVNIRGNREFYRNTPILNAAYGLNKECNFGYGYKNNEQKIFAEIEAVKIVKFLVSKGADLHATDSSANRRNALHLAAIGGRSRMIRALVELGIDINSRDRMNVTALIQATGSGCLNVVKTCVELGADINMEMNGNRTALDAALEFGTEEAYKWGKVTCKEHDKIIEYLKEHGAKSGKELVEE